MEVGSPAPPEDRSPRALWLAWRWRLLGLALAIVTSVVVFPMAEADTDTAQALTAQVIARGHASQLSELVGADAAALDGPLRVALSVDGPPGASSAIRAELARIQGVEIIGSEPGVHRLHSVATIEAEQLRLQSTWTPPGAAAEETLLDDARRVGRWTAILPPLIAILVALFLRQLLIAMGLAVWLGAVVNANLAPIEGTKSAVGYLFSNVTDSFNLYIIGFTFGLVGMVHIITRMGGMAGVLAIFSRLATSARSTRLATALVGFVVFFDDYANTIVVGTTMRPLTDQKRISREKLAYLVDSTSAPIAGIAIISTWIGYEVGLFEDLARQLGINQSGYEIFLSIIPLRFYCLFALAFVFLNVLLSRDFGPMLKAERRAFKTGEVLRPGAVALTSAAFSSVRVKEGVEPRWYNAMAPIFAVIAVTFFGMYWSGWSGKGAIEAIPALGDLFAGKASPVELASAWSVAASEMFNAQAWRDAFSNADNALVLFWAAVVGSLVALALAVGQRLLNVREALSAWLKAIPAMWMAVAILVLAWSIRSVCDDLGTSIYLVGAVQDLISLAMLPILTFLLAAGVAFATGTSWGAMGILLPTMIPLAFHLGDGSAQGPIILMLCFSAVLDGAIFGDHCSPISDTTVMSSIASSCDHVDHVRTQFPYALTVMAAAGAFGYLGVAFGLSPWVALLLGILSLAGVLRLIGRPIETS
ncbi:MAG: Na+/H+ antiporter NhaC family protein [Bradymonadaceae bacterium]|nr:Na+/H+ antiporter NhaC family protein [Lujinxingiaceae bacterium]